MVTDLVSPVLPMPVAVVTLLGAFAPEALWDCLRLSAATEALVALEREGSSAFTVVLRPALPVMSVLMPPRDIPWRPPEAEVA